MFIRIMMFIAREGLRWEAFILFILPVVACWNNARHHLVEARGVEPLSSSLSTQPSTCLSGVEV